MNLRFTTTCGAVAIVAALLGTGCARAQHVEVITVLANGDCQTTQTGVRTIDYETLAAFRGTRLIGMSEPEGSTQQPAQLVAIVPGQFPTAGYSVALQEGTVLTADLLTIKVKTDRPPADAMLAQVITHPCLVVSIGDPKVGRVKVLDDSSKVIGEVSFASSSQASKAQ